MKEIPLPHGMKALVSDEDYEEVSKFKWHLSGVPHRRYVVRNLNKGQVGEKLLHRFIAKPPAGMDTDHINRNTLDCTRENLRLANRHQNSSNRIARNRHGLKGVMLIKGRYWAAMITVKYQRIHLGMFDSKEEAARAYDEAAKEHFGRFARLNFPQ